MTEHEMQESHTLEYRRILAAEQYLLRINGKGAKTPQTFDENGKKGESEKEDSLLVEAEDIS